MLSLNLNSLRLFMLVCLAFAFIQFSTQLLLISDGLMIDSLIEQFNVDRIEEVIANSKKWQWLSYAVIPLMLLLKFTFVASCLGLGYYFTHNRFTFRSFFNAAIQAELVFLLPILLKMLWFLFIQTDYDLTDLQQFYPLALINFFPISDVRSYWLVPLQTLNLFEVAYWLLLAYGIGQGIKLPFERSFGLVMSSYGVGLLLWVVLVMFLVVSYS
jgi:hypothetical protein